MKINTTRASKILGGVSKAVVRKLIDQGKVNDYGVTKPGGQRHEYVLDSTEVKQFAANHVRQGRAWVKIDNGGQAPPKRAYTKRQSKVAVPAKNVLEQPQPKVTTGSSGLLERIERMEKILFG